MSGKTTPFFWIFIEENMLLTASLGQQYPRWESDLAKFKLLCYLYRNPKTNVFTGSMNPLIFRFSALLLHILANVLIVIYFTDFDLTGSWVKFIAFIVMIIVLLFLFIRHIISFINFIKSRQ